MAGTSFFGGVMRIDALRMFLSEENIKEHERYLYELKLKYSVLTKSAPILKGLTLSEIWRKLPRFDIKNEAISLLSEIKAHEIFFNSFSKKRVRSQKLISLYGSEDAFIYELFLAVKETKSGFLYVYCGNKIRYEICPDGGFFFKAELPTIAVDLFEHTYFKDYAFDRKRYIESALAYLDLSKFDENSKKDCKMSENVLE